jgi:hypothetical protein
VGLHTTGYHLGPVLKALVWFHRWVGIFLCCLFSMWFASGAVMVFVPFPELLDSDRAASGEAIDFSRLRISPGDAAAASGGLTIDRLVSIAGVPAYIATKAGAPDLAISGETGHALSDVTRNQVEQIGARFAHASIKAVSGPFDYDQWIVYQGFTHLRPFYKVRIDGADAVDLYVSARTGEVVQRTRSFERAWNWAGSIVHWIYFVPIRRVFALWDHTVWSLGLVGLLTAAAGIWLGIQRTQYKMRSKRPGLTPYKGLMKWHHVVGLVAGCFVFTWIFSGWLSMDYGRLFSEGTASQVELSRYQAPILGRVVTHLSVADFAGLSEASQVSFAKILGYVTATAIGKGPPQVLIATARGPIIVDRIPTPIIEAAVKATWPREAIQSINSVASDSAYSKAEYLPSSALLLRMVGPSSFGLYVDGLDGKLLVVVNRSRKIYDWLYYMLHTFNFPGLSSRPLIRIPIVLTLLTLGFTLSVTSVLVGMRRLGFLRPKV